MSNERLSFLRQTVRKRFTISEATIHIPIERYGMEER